VAKKELPEDEGPSKEWLASYADAMTLLLAFFIMMFAFALIDEGKYFDFKVGVMAALGVPDPLTDNTDSILDKGTGVLPQLGYNPVPPAEDEAEEAEEAIKELAEAGMVTPENAEDVRDILTEEFGYTGAADYVQVGIDERGVFIRFDGQVLFESGQAELDDNGLILLATAADVLGVIDNRLEVEGHTDSQPTGSAWPSNWELSAARSSRVVRWFIDSGIPDPRLIAVGLADTRPRGDNATPEGRQQNRRVEIVIRVDGLEGSGVPIIDPGIDDPLQLDPAEGSGSEPVVIPDPIVPLEEGTVDAETETVRQ
jgi:chemotaxis protein MotB